MIPPAPSPASRRRPRALPALLAALALLALGCPQSPPDAPPPPAVRQWTAMGTRVRLSVRGPGAEAAADAMAPAARDALEAVEAETSAFRPGNPLARTAASAGSGEWTPTGPFFDAALDLSLAVAAATDGAFNPLVAPLMERHGFPRRPPGPPPAPRDLPPQCLDWRAIQRRPGACRLPLSGMRLDFGGVAKGLGADLAAAAARDAAPNDFLLDVGGTLVGRGTWTAGLRAPRAAPSAPPLRPFTLADGTACATSGDYERPGHLLDPRTGRPADAASVLQVTVLAPTAAQADAWSTALFVLGPDAGRAALSNAVPPVAAAWVVPAADGGVEVVHVPAPPP